MIKKKDKKGATAILVGLMLAIVAVVLGLAIAGPLTEVIDETKSDADCSQSNITKEEDANCTIFEFYTPVFVGALFGIAGVIVAIIGGGK